MKMRLGINNCFAVKRWPEPSAWAGMVRDRLGLRFVQFSLDLLDPRTDGAARREMIARTRAAAAECSLEISSAFTGLAAYSSSMLLHPSLPMRMDALEWYERTVGLSAELGAEAAGGHFGALSCTDYAERRRRDYLEDFLMEALVHLSGVARREGLERLLWEPMPVLREAPATIREAERLHEKANRSAVVPIGFCLDLGHQCAAGTRAADRDPYEWLRRLGPLCPCIHLQQTDGEADHHWPFTERYNASGIIHPEQVVDALERSGAQDVELIFEVIHPFEAADEAVLEDLALSVNHWRGVVS